LEPGTAGSSRRHWQVEPSDLVIGRRDGSADRCERVVAGFEAVHAKGEDERLQQPAQHDPEPFRQQGASRFPRPARFFADASPGKNNAAATTTHVVSTQRGSEEKRAMCRSRVKESIGHGIIVHSIPPEIKIGRPGHFDQQNPPVLSSTLSARPMNGVGLIRPMLTVARPVAPWPRLSEHPLWTNPGPNSGR
jgi:hypothetical protein